MKVLWILCVWPEPVSSAAGTRSLELIKILLKAGYNVEACSPCQSNTYMQELAALGVRCQRLAANDCAFDRYIEEYKPEIVFFDRFIIEEQFSWRVKKFCPEAIRVLDSIDLHFLRRARQAEVEKGNMHAQPTLSMLHSEDAIREIASIYRSDLTLIVSDYEMRLLNELARIPDFLIRLLRFSAEPLDSFPAFEERKSFVAIGNFNHSPNYDSFAFLRDNLWSRIREKVRQKSGQEVELHIYGAYPKNNLLSGNNRLSGIRMMGWAEKARQTLASYRLNLAPLRFGAGIKGKILDGWAAGTPCLASSVAAEGMSAISVFGGSVVDDWDEFAERAADLYCSRDLWIEAQLNGFQIMKAQYLPDQIEQRFLEIVDESRLSLQSNRLRNIIAEILWHQQFRSTEYFSRWIEVKNSNS